MLLLLPLSALAGPPPQVVALALDLDIEPERIVVADGAGAPPPFEEGDHSSPDVPLLYQDLYEVLAPLAYDSGWQPAGSPIQVAVRVNAEGGAAVEMQGTSHLTWPQAVTHGQTTWTDAGFFTLDAALVAEFDVQFDVGGVVWSDTLASESVSFYGEEVFTPFLLPNGDPTIVEVDASGPDTTLIDLGYNVFTGVELTFRTDMRTEVVASLEGEKITVESTSESFELLEAGESVVFSPPAEGSLNLLSTYQGHYEALLDLVFTPVVGVCVDIIGCFDLAAFDIPVPLAEGDEIRDFEPLDIEHPVPHMGVDDSPYDFGEVDLGDIATLELPISNVGSLDVYGGAGFVGTGDFSLFPEDIRAGQDEVDGIVVTFAPQVVGLQEVTLVLVTNDPYLANLEIPLVGTGVEPEVATDPGVTVVSTENTCGCTAQPRPAQLGWLVVALGGVFLRRRRD